METEINQTVPSDRGFTADCLSVPLAELPALARRLHGYTIDGFVCSETFHLTGLRREEATDGKARVCDCPKGAFFCESCGVLVSRPFLCPECTGWF